MRIVRVGELVEVPWRNGGGITREIAHRREGAATVWRLSMADVAGDGPFSTFTGLTRILTVIDGAGLRLSGPDGDSRAPYAAPVTFDGGAPITATLLDGPVRDLNLMVDPLLCRAVVEVLHGPKESVHPAAPGRVHGVHCLRGTVRVEPETTLAPGDTALAEETTLAIALDAAALALSIMVEDIPKD